MKKVSVIIAAFQAERWLEQCLCSIDKQHLPEGWETEVLTYQKGRTDPEDDTKLSGNAHSSSMRSIS